MATSEPYVHPAGHSSARYNCVPNPGHACLDLLTCCGDAVPLCVGCEILDGATFRAWRGDLEGTDIAGAICTLSACSDEVSHVAAVLPIRGGLETGDGL